MEKEQIESMQMSSDEQQISNLKRIEVPSPIKEAPNPITL